MSKRRRRKRTKYLMYSNFTNWMLFKYFNKCFLHQCNIFICWRFQKAWRACYLKKPGAIWKIPMVAGPRKISTPAWFYFTHTTLITIIVELCGSNNFFFSNLFLISWISEGMAFYGSDEDTQDTDSQDDSETWSSAWHGDETASDVQGLSENDLKFSVYNQHFI